MRALASSSTSVVVGEYAWCAFLFLQVARTQGVPTAMDLQRQFIEKKDAALAAALVKQPGGLFHRVVARAFAALLIRPDANDTVRRACIITRGSGGGVFAGLWVGG